MADEQVENEHDPHFEPIISLPEVCSSTLEEDEIELFKTRAKLFRYDKKEVPPEWKERGTGDIKLLRHKEKHSVRVVMRRDKTLKLCANHYVTPWMELKPSHGSDRAWVYSSEGDFSDGEMKQELFAVRFAKTEDAKKWKEKFEEAKVIVETECELYKNGSENKPFDESLSDKGDKSESENDEEEKEEKEEVHEKKEEKEEVHEKKEEIEEVQEEQEENVSTKEEVVEKMEKLNVDEK